MHVCRYITVIQAFVALPITILNRTLTTRVIYYVPSAQVHMLSPVSISQVVTALFTHLSANKLNFAFSGTDGIRYSFINPDGDERLHWPSQHQEQ